MDKQINIEPYCKNGKHKLIGEHCVYCNENILGLILAELRAHSEKHANYIFVNAVYGFLTTLDEAEIKELATDLKLL